jgi:hypothetical protein
VLYLATDKATVSAEFHRLVARQGLSPKSFLPRAMYRYEIDLVGLLDLTQVAAGDAVKGSRPRRPRLITHRRGPVDRSQPTAREL